MNDNESFQINLNSKFATRYINNSNSECLFDLPYIEIPSQHHIHLSVKSAVIPYSFYNINHSNNFFIFIADNLTFTYILDVGNYNVSQLVKHLNTLMFESGLNCSYNIITNKLSFTHLIYDFSISKNSTCLNFMGFDYAIIYQSTNKKITAPNCLNLGLVQSIHITSNFISGSFNSSDLYRQNILCTIPLNSQPYSNIVYVNDSNFSTNLYVNMLNEIYIKLIDQDNNILNLNGLDWSITLQIDVVNFYN